MMNHESTLKELLQQKCDTRLTSCPGLKTPTGAPADPAFNRQLLSSHPYKTKTHKQLSRNVHNLQGLLRAATCRVQLDLIKQAFRVNGQGGGDAKRWISSPANLPLTSQPFGLTGWFVWPVTARMTKQK